MSCSDNQRSYTTYQNYLATKNQTGCCCYLVGPTGPTGSSSSSTTSSLASRASIPGGEGDLLFEHAGSLGSVEAPYNLNWSGSGVFDISASNVFIHSGITTSTIKVTETAGHGGKIQLMESSSPSKHYVALKAPDAISNDITFTLPLGYPGADGAILVGDKNGELRWVSSPLGSSSPLPSGYLSPVIELSTLYGDASQSIISSAKDTYVARFLPPRSAMYNKITIGLVAAPHPHQPVGSVRAGVYVADTMNNDHTYTLLAHSTDISIPSGSNFSSEQTVILPIRFSAPFSLTDTSGYLVALKWIHATNPLHPLHVAGQSYNPTHTGTSGWLFDSSGGHMPSSIDTSTLTNSNFTMWIRIS